MRSMAVTRLCIVMVLAVGATAFPGLGKGRALEKREVDGYTAPHHHRHHPAFPYIQGINATNPAPAVSRCLQPSKTGICRANMPRWFYDAAATACRRFTYGGCQGNDNNFPSEDHCRAVCPDEIVCPTHPAKTCRVSESACATSVCPRHPTAVCFVMPCVCTEVFVDSKGRPVTCVEPVTDTTTITTSSTMAESTSPAPDATTTSIPGDGEAFDSTNLALQCLVALIFTMVAAGVLLLGISAVLRRRRRVLRSPSTTTLISGSPDSMRMPTTHNDDRL